jgi:membrane-bound inhibitor of C-type lysozyme
MTTPLAISTTVFRAVLVSLPLCTIAGCASRAPVVSPSPAAAGDACQAAHLDFSVDPGDGRFNGMSHAGAMLTVRNTGTAACTLPAWPTPSLTDAGKRPLNIVAPASSAPAPSAIRLAPGSAVESEMRWVSGNVYEDGHCESPAFIVLAIGAETVSSPFTGQLCGAGGKPSTYTLTPFRPAAAAPTLSYTCDDGRLVQASYPDDTTAVVALDGDTHRLHIAVSADGARYIGEHWQWWTKGMHDAWLAPLRDGETYPSASGVACHAP